MRSVAHIRLLRGSIVPAFLLFFLALQVGFAQKRSSFTHADSLRGGWHEVRQQQDLLHYHLRIAVFPEIRYLSGSNRLSFKGLSRSKEVQVDLSPQFDIQQIRSSTGEVKWQRKGSSIQVLLSRAYEKDELFWVEVQYSGHPQVSANPPWESGFVWQKDDEGFPWIGVACEGEGGSLWFPAKDHHRDKPDSALLQFEVPKNLSVVSNGRFEKKESASDTTHRFTYRVTYPIHHYNITFNAGVYTHWKETMVLPNSGNNLALNFYALRANSEQAKLQWQQVRKVIGTLSELFGDYPFVRDGYTLVHTPYLGMEHQSCVAYGDKFQNNAFGFDFILMHETGHEWWGNLVSAADHADLWLHESFCTYAEVLYVEKLQGKDASLAYLENLKKKIKNRSPMLGNREVYFNDWKDSDIYYKGAWMLHSLRFLVNNDALWLSWFRHLTQRFAQVPCLTEDVLQDANRYFKGDYTDFFYSYLKQPNWPVLDWEWEDLADSTRLRYRWKGVSDGFKARLPLKITDGSYVNKLGESQWLEASFPKGTRFHEDFQSFLFKSEGAKKGKK